MCFHRRCHHAFDCRRRANENRVGQVNGEESEGVHMHRNYFNVKTEARAMNVQLGAEQPLYDRNLAFLRYSHFLRENARKQQRSKHLSANASLL